MATETIANGNKLNRTQERRVRLFVLHVRLMTCFPVLTQRANSSDDNVYCMTNQVIK